MTLAEVIRSLDKFESEDVIFAAEPWRESSPAVVMPSQSDGRLGDEEARLAMRYFLEIFLAREIVEDWRATRPTPPSHSEICSRLIGYATNDA